RGDSESHVTLGSVNQVASLQSSTVVSFTGLAEYAAVPCRVCGDSRNIGACRRLSPTLQHLTRWAPRAGCCFSRPEQPATRYPGFAPPSHHSASSPSSLKALLSPFQCHFQPPQRW